MLDLGKFLRDRKKDVVNRWQNSTVLDAVSANTQADQARRVAQGQPQQYQGNKFAQGLTNIVGANKMQDTSVQDRQDDQTFKNDLSNIINLRTSGQITPEQARGKALNAAPTGNTDYTKDVLNNQANRSSIGQAVLPALGTFAKPFATGLSDVGTAVGTGVEAFTPFNGVGKNIQDVSKRQSQGIDDLYKASSFNGGQKGENRLVTGLSSGVGSLASSLATGATKGLTTNAGKTLLSPSTMSGLQFGLSAGAGQMRDATANNKSAVRSFGTGLAGGAIEAGLEKVGLDKYLGAGGGFVRKTGTRMLTEGLQEGAQSLGQSLITGSFKRVDPVQALKQAALEGGMGGLVGGIGGVGGDLALNLQQSQSVPQDVKQQVVQSKPVLQQTGIPAQPGSIRERIQLAKDSVTNQLASAVTPLDQSGSIPNIFNRQQEVAPTVRANTNELGALKSYLDYQYGLTPSGAPTAQELNLLNRDVRTAAQRLGIPLNNGLNNNAEVIREYLDTVGTQNAPQYTTLESQQPKPSLMDKLGLKQLNEGGYAKNPFYDKKNDVAQDLTPEQSDFINQYANMLEDMGSGNGVTVNPETNQIVSSNYRNPELGSGKVSKAEWFDQARKELESGKGAYGASEEYKALSSKITPNNQRAIDSYSTPKPVTEYKVGEKVSNSTMSGEVTGVITKIPDFTKDLRFKGNDFNLKLDDGTVIKTDGAGFDSITTQKSSSKTKSPKPPVQDLPSISTRIAESKQKVQTSQSPVLPQEIPTTASSVDRSSNMAKDTPIAVDSTTKQGKKQGNSLSAENFAKTFGGTVKQAEKTLSDTPRFDAATRTDKGKDANKLFESMKTDTKINNATKEAQASGKELNFYAKKDASGRSVGIEQFDPKIHRIEAGFVVDEKQNVLGNHIKVDANGIQVNIGGKVVNMDSVLGNPLDWGSTSATDKAKKGRYKLSETMNRNIDNNAPSKEIANKTKNFLWSNKVKAEADMRTELESEYKALGDRIKKTNKAKPLGVSSKQWKDDIFSVLNGDKTDAQIKESYGEKSAQAILDYKKETRTLYDSLLQRVNVERVKFGQPEIQARKDYITHLQELNGNKGFVAEVYGQMKNSFADEGMGKTRNGVPGEIAGRTENFKPISKYNPFLQRRTGTKSERDPYMAVQEYLQPALYNIHMTESGARARAVESAFRTAEAIKNTEPRTLLDESKKITDKYQTNSDNAKLITGFQEYANAIAGKTQRFDRQLVDSSDAAAKGLKGWQALQRTGGQATILGNASSILAQPLNQVVGLADAGPINYMKGISAAVAGDPAIEKSAFIKARETEPTKAIRKTGEKIMDAGSVPLQKVELASVKLMWHTQHQKALSEGYKGQEAIQRADLNTERLVAGRGIADKPELYRSTIANGVLQYTLEVNASNKTFWNDLNPKQKATFLVASTATNTVMGAVTGFEPLPDFLKAFFETGKDIINGKDDKNIAQNIVQGGQRMLDQYATMNPLVGAPANLLPQAQRKAIFGQDSDIGRFSGSTAPVQVVTNAVKAGSDLTKGNYKSARDNALRDVPFGNQIRKTVTGAEMLNRGYAVDSSGKKTFDAPTSPLGKAQALVFGPSATKPAREYYDNKSTSKSSSSVSTKDAQGNETTQDDFASISKAAFNSPKGKEFVALKNEDARKEFARQSPDNRAIYNDYKAMQKAFNGGDKLLATGLDDNSTKTLQKYDRLTPKAKENIFNSKKNAEYEYELASYNNKKANGEVNLVDEINTQQKLNKLKATKDFEKGYRDIYAGLSKTEAYNLITSDPNGKKIADQLLAIDDALVKAGNKAKFRDKYGNVSFAPKSSSGRKGGRSKSNGTVEANSLRTDTLSKLNSLLAGAQKPVTGYKKAVGGKVALKKITVKK